MLGSGNQHRIKPSTRNEEKKNSKQFEKMRDKKKQAVEKKKEKRVWTDGRSFFTNEGRKWKP